MDISGTYSATAPVGFFHGSPSLTIDGVEIILRDESARSTSGGLFEVNSSTSSLTVINSTLTYDGGETGSVTRGGIINTTSTGKVELTNSILNGGNVKEGANGGQVYIIKNGNFKATNCLFSGGKAANGGAIYLQPKAETTIRGCAFEGNTATEKGGAIYKDGAAYLYVEGCTFKDTSAAAGGALYQGSGRIYTSDSTFTNCPVISKPFRMPPMPAHKSIVLSGIPT
jgi:predicted outer membrane repeat protein